MKRVFLGFVCLIFLVGVLGCKESEQYFSLSLSSTSGGAVFVELDEGTKRDGRYLQGSVVFVEAKAEDGFALTKLVVNGVQVVGSSYTLTMDCDSVVSATFKKQLQALGVIERTKNAIVSEFGLDDFDAADGIEGAIIQQTRVDSEASFRIDTRFSYSKNSPDSFFGLEVKDTYAITTVFGICYIDGSAPLSAKLGFNFFGVESYFVYVPTLLEIGQMLQSEYPADDIIGGSSEQFASIELLEMIGVLYDITNKESKATLSVSLTDLIYLAAELLAATNDDLPLEYLEQLEQLPQINIAFAMEFEGNGDDEHIDSISYTIVISDSRLPDNKPLQLTADIQSLSLGLWQDTPPAVPYDLNSATEASFEELLQIIQEIIGQLS